MKLRRGIRVNISTDFNVTQDDKLKLTGDDNYFIYMKNVNLNKNGNIVGRYLGVANKTLIDGYCRDAVYDKNLGYTVDGNRVRTARMVAVKNDTDKQVIIIIH